MVFLPTRSVRLWQISGKRSIAPGSLGHRVGRGEDACHGGEQRKPAGVVWRLPVPAQVVGGQKMEAVLRLLRGESLEELSRELQVEAHRLAAWRDDFLEGGKEGLKGQRPDRSPEDRQLRDAERKIGQLTMENEILRSAAEKRGIQIPPAKRPR
jgi:transposase-like protein